MAEPADDWTSVAEAAPPADDWAPVAQTTPVTAGGGRSIMPLAAQVAPHVERVMEAFGHGFREGFGPDKIGLSDESAKWLSEKKIFGPAQGGYDNPLQAANELLIDTVAGAADLAARGSSGIFRGAQAAVFTGLGEGPFARDIAAMPEAFFGSPHPTGIPKGLPEIPEGARATEAVVADAARASEPAAAINEAPTLTPAVIIDGKVYTGTNHAAAFTSALKDIGDKPYKLERADGYVLNNDEYVTREEANKIKDTFVYRDAETRRLTGMGLVEQASDLGVIGPEKPSISEGTPKEAAEATVRRAMAPARAPDEKVTQEVGTNPAVDKAGNIRLDQIGINADAKDVIQKAAEANDDFNAARRGEVPLAQIGSLSDASGIPGDVLQGNQGLGRLMQNDAVVRTWLQAFHQASDEIAGQLAQVKLTGAAEDIDKLREMKLRFQHMQEQVSGLTAEAGRTLAVFREFYDAKGKAENIGKLLEDNPGNDADSLRKLADTAGALDPRTQLPKYLNDMRQPGFFDKFMWYWVNSLISGPTTHIKYMIANASFGAYEAGVVTPIAGAVGAVRRGLGGGREGVFVGEGAAGLWGLVAGTPDALVAAAKAARTGLQTALPGEVAQNIIPKQNQNITFQQRPIQGVAGDIIGIPSRGASAIHSFFNFLGYRASIEKQAYRAAAKEGLDGDAFWQARQSAVDNPTKEMMDDAIAEGYRLTYISELGPAGKKISSAVKATKVGRLLLPFTHIPFNILARGVEGTPLAFLPAETRADLKGTNGVVKQDMATARIVAGTAVGAYVMNLAANDRMTGYGPTDPKERAQWMALGHQPYSVRIGDYWYSFNRFGSLGTMLGIHANLAEIMPHMKADAEELTKALTMTVHSTGRLLEDEVGMQGLAGLIEAINEPERKGTRFVSNFAGSLMPFSSAQRQIASAMDPYMRETKSVVDGLRYYIPAVREGLLPKRDWTGTPIANAGYGGDVPGAPGVSAIIQHRAVGTDPIALEMKAVDLHPAPPKNVISGVQLPPKLYDEYQSTAGPMTRVALEGMVSAPGWSEMPVFVRKNAFEKTIEAMRKTAGAMMQVRHPEILQQGIDNRVSQIQGVKKTKLKD